MLLRRWSLRETRGGSLPVVENLGTAVLLQKRETTLNFLKMLTRAAKASSKAARRPAPAPKPMSAKPRAASQSASAGRTIVCGENSYRFEVVGESRYQEALGQIVGGHNREGHSHDCYARLVPEPDNTFDPNAIQVVIDGEKVGYIPKEGTARIHAALASFGPLACRARIVGGWRTNQHDAGHFGVKLAIPNRGQITVA